VEDSLCQKSRALNVNFEWCRPPPCSSEWSLIWFAAQIILRLEHFQVLVLKHNITINICVKFHLDTCN